MFGRARFVLGSHTALTVPRQSISSEGQLQKVFVITDGRARARLVTTGAPFEDGSEVLSGLVEGEVVVSPIPPGLIDGSKVEVRQ